MAAPIYWTADMVRALPDDGNRHELVYGELLVTPAPRPWHQIVAGRLFVALASVKHDRFTKRRRYQDARVPLYWIVDAAERTAEVWGPDDLFPGVEQDRLVWHPAGAAAPFTLALAELFTPV